MAPIAAVAAPAPAANPFATETLRTPTALHLVPGLAVPQQQQQQTNAQLSPAERRAAFERTAMPYRGELLGSAIKLTRDPRDAEDLVQETLLKAFTFFDRFEAGTNCRAWLYRIMTNTFINLYRRRIKETEIFGAEQADVVCECSHGEASRDGFGENPERILSDRQIDRDVRRAVRSLPPSFRFVLVLADLQDFAYKDIAEILDIPVGTVMSRLYRGRRLLRSQLERLTTDGAVRDEVLRLQATTGLVREAGPRDLEDDAPRARRARCVA